VHEHEYGQSVYLAKTNLSGSADIFSKAIEQLKIDYEPEKGEDLTLHVINPAEITELI